MLQYSLLLGIKVAKSGDRIYCEGELDISPGKLLTAWAINQIIDPICATELEISSCRGEKLTIQEMRLGTC